LHDQNAGERSLRHDSVSLAKSLAINRCKHRLQSADMLKKFFAQLIMHGGAKAQDRRIDGSDLGSFFCYHAAKYSFQVF
jgi:hypothetical protein